MTIEGYFNNNDEPAVTLDFASTSIEVLIDTGFAGSLIVPQSFANDLTLHFEGVEEFYTATGQLFTAPAYFAFVDWFGQQLKVTIAVSAEIREALLGNQMLSGCWLTIDYAERTVKVTRSSG